jgi:hypothetical protein
MRIFFFYISSCTNIFSYLPIEKGRPRGPSDCPLTYPKYCCSDLWHHSLYPCPFLDRATLYLPQAYMYIYICIIYICIHINMCIYIYIHIYIHIYTYIRTFYRGFLQPIYELIQRKNHFFAKLKMGPRAFGGYGGGLLTPLLRWRLTWWWCTCFYVYI